MAGDTKEDAHELCRTLAKACGEAGLIADQLGPTRVRVGVTGAGMLAEVIRCMPGEGDVLYWHWSWDEPICPAANIAQATKAIAYVVTPVNA
jgi:hypothetical protein